MAVYDHGYASYGGGLTPDWSRFGVISRYDLQETFQSRVFLMFFVACLVWPLACATFIYLHYNIEALTAMDLSILDLIKIDSVFFRRIFLGPQSMLAFVLVLVVGPALVSPDLRNGALPLYLSRPLNKIDYVAGKLLVLVLLTSLITWIPGLALFAFQGYLAGDGWFMDNLRIGLALVIGALVWVFVLSLFSLAVSAWVKWKPWARVLFLGVLFIGAAIGQLFNLLYDTWWGSLFKIDDQVDVIWDQLFGIPSRSPMPTIAAWIALGLLAAVSWYFLLRRIRAFEVVS